ncbi:MAG: hypothetical protein AMS14_09390 [Planctomycetes bacterium DG_20]|nr:MAG: hypothetical protein AMS14_09390 [Planctomycetes bacterium DG_20]
MVERHRHDGGQIADPACGLQGGERLFERRHRLDADALDAGLGARRDLFGKGVDELPLGPRAERRQELARRPDRGEYRRAVARAAAGPNLIRVPPSVFVSTIRAPASTYARATSATAPGFSRFHASGGVPGGRPRRMSCVPIAPSATR